MAFLRDSLLPPHVIAASSSEALHPYTKIVNLESAMTSVLLEPYFHVAALIMDKNSMPWINGARLHVPTTRNHPPHLRSMVTSSILTLSPIGFSAKSSKPSKQNHCRQLNRRNYRILASRDSDILQDTPVGVDVGGEDRVRQFFTIAEFEEALETAKNKLVVIEFAASHSARSAKIYPAMVDLSKKTKDVEFYIVMGDLSEDMKSLCARYKITTVPYFLFFKGGKLVHEEEGLDSERLQGDVLYYGDNDAPIHQLRSSDDVEALIQRHATDHKLVVLDVSLKNCGPCVNVYPTVVKLAKRMTDIAVFARMFGDENDSCKALLKKMDVKEVPCFLFLRDGKVLGRYVGSGKGELIGEVLRHQGVRVTY